jgi:type IV pilus assembly protein PilA
MVLKRMGLAGHNKKGFTLVEVIVVLVIIAILLAIAVPSLTGYIDRAKDQALEATGRNIQVALQAIASEEYGRTGNAVAVNNGNGTTQVNGTALGTQVNALIGGTDIDATKTADTDEKALTAVTITNSQVIGFTYTLGGKKITYSSAGFVIP